MGTDNFVKLCGKTLSKIEKFDDEVLIFHTSDLDKFIMYHEQDCCEKVFIESITGDLKYLIGVPILKSSVEYSLPLKGKPIPITYEDEYDKDNYWEQQWVFYKLATIKGYVDIRWFGANNGAYSMEVTVQELGYRQEQFDIQESPEFFDVSLSDFGNKPDSDKEMTIVAVKNIDEYMIEKDRLLSSGMKLTVYD